MSGIEKSYGWCQNCGALVFGNLKCHKCDGKVKTFCVDMELFTLKQQRDDLLAAAKAWLKVESEMSPNNPCPDLVLRANYRKEAINLTNTAIAKCEGTPGETS